MIKIQTALLAVALTTPFGLAIHDDLTRERPDPDRLQALALALGGDDPNVLVADDPELADKLGLGELPDEGLIAPHELDEALQAAREAPPPPLGSLALRQLAGTERASPGPALAALRFGMTADQARAAVPRLADWRGPGDQLARVDVLPEYLGKGETRLTAVSIEFLDDVDRVAAELRALWGQPQPKAGDATIWMDENAGRRAVLTSVGDTVILTFGQVMTVDLLVGKRGDKALFGFSRGKRVLGARIRDVENALDDLWRDPYYGEYAVLELPGLNVDPGARTTTRVELGVAKGKVTGVHFGFDCGARCDEVHAALRSRHGEPTAAADGALIYNARPELRVYTEGEAGDVLMTIKASLPAR